ncbi:MAG: MGMT family protein [Promethearchaeota archaeon]|nr:MAG: MGMT family protein [Candidatus Lokiarchaeota archaeon]
MSYDYLNQGKKLILNEIKFFKSQIDANKYMKEKKLEIEDKQDSIKQTKINDLMNLFKEYFLGKNINLIQEVNKFNVDLGLYEKFYTPFSQKVIEYITKLNRGETTTYSEIGDIIGSKGYQAIGNVLRKNPLPLIIPCHRVIRKNGKIGGFNGVSEDCWETNLKKDLLRIEGYNSKGTQHKN